MWLKLRGENPEKVQLLLIGEGFEDVPVKIPARVALPSACSLVKKLSVVRDVLVNLLRHANEGGATMVGGTLPIQQRK